MPGAVRVLARRRLEVKYEGADCIFSLSQVTQTPDHPAARARQQAAMDGTHPRKRPVDCHPACGDSLEVTAPTSRFLYPSSTRLYRSDQQHVRPGQVGAALRRMAGGGRTTATAATGPPLTRCTTIYTANGATGDRTMPDVVGVMEQQREFNGMSHGGGYANEDSLTDALNVPSMARHGAANLAPRRPDEVQS